MFDMNVHRRDKNGNVVDAQPYRLSIVNGEARYERPVGSGFWYAADGTMLAKPEEKAEAKVETKQADEVVEKQAEPAKPAAPAVSKGR